MIIRESLGFVRGEGPHKALNIGVTNSIQLWLEEMGIDLEDSHSDTHLELQKDGTYKIHSHNSLIFTNKGLTEFPHFIKFGEVYSDFDISNNRFTSLHGMPDKCHHTFWANHNELTTLEGGPTRVGGSFMVMDNYLEDFKGAPSHVSSNFFAHANPIKSLEGLSHTIEGMFKYDGVPKVFTASEFEKYNIYGGITWNEGEIKQEKDV